MLDSKALIDDLRADLSTAHSSGQVCCCGSPVVGSTDADRDRARWSLAVRAADEDDATVGVTTLAGLKESLVRCWMTRRVVLSTRLPN